MPGPSISHPLNSDAALDGSSQPSGEPAAAHEEVRLTPVNRRGWSRAMLPFLTIFAPIYLTTLVISDGHRLLPVIVAIGVTMLVAIVLVSAFSSANIQLRSDGITHTGLVSPARFVPTADIASAVILKVYDTESLRLTTQLFVLEAAERTRFRMRGQYWTNEQIEKVATHIEVPIVRIDDPLTQVELRTARRDQLDWYERRPLLGAAVVGAAGAVVAIAIVGATLIATGAMPVYLPPAP